MSVLKQLNMLQHVSIIIQIIFRELVGSLLKSLNLKVFVSFLKLWKLFVVMRQHNVWCVCVAFCVERYAGIPLHTERYTHQTLCCHFTTNNLHNFKKTFKFSDTNKEPTSSLKMI